MNKSNRPAALLTLVQLLCALAAVLIAAVAFTPAAMLVHYIRHADVLQHDNTLIVELFGAVYCLRDAAAGALLICAVLEAMSVCGRLKKASAFTEKNIAALGRIALETALAGGVTLLFGDSLIPFLLQGLPAVSPVVQRLLLPFLLLGLALMVRTVQVLMRRALTLQEESDLTV